MKRTLISFLAASLISFSGFSQHIGKVKSAQDLTKIAENIMVKESIPEMAFAVITKDSILRYCCILAEKINNEYCI